MVDVPSEPAVLHRPHRPWLAALLSFVFPGAGQAYAGRRRDAVVFAVPVLILVAGAAALVTGIAGDRNSLLSAEFLAGVMAVNVALLAWRLIAIAHAGLTPAEHVRGRGRRVAGAVVIGLVVASMAMHVWVGLVVAQLENTLSQVFATEPDDEGRDVAGGVAVDVDHPVPQPRPELTWTGVERLTVLLVGTDAAPGREAVLADVVLVVSVDPVDQSAVMISVPRDTGWIPLPDERLFPGGLYPGRVNEVAAQAELDPATWCPDEPATGCGMRTLQAVVGLYLGVEIHHYATVDMVGFAEMIDAVGGLELCLPGRLVDPQFDGSLENRERGEPLILPPGCHHYSGLDALAYARSRKGWIEMPDGSLDHQTDFDRNERQQEVLLALRRELARADTLLELPGLIAAIGRTVTSDVPREQAGDLAGLLPVVAGPDIERIVLDYPQFVDLPIDPDVNYLLIPKRDAIRAEMARLFGEDELVGWYLGTRQPSPASVEGAGTPDP